MMTEKG